MATREPPKLSRFLRALEKGAPGIFFIVAIVVAGLSIAPGIWVYDQIFAAVQSWPSYFRYPALGIGLGTAFYVYGFTLSVVAPLANFMLRGRPIVWRGSWVSLKLMPWYLHGALTFIMRYTFLEFVTPTIFNQIFFRLMGMKIGRSVVINTSHIMDPGFIELEDHVTIGGSAFIFAHYGQGGYLVIAPVKIERGAVIGQNATIMGGTTIGAGAKVLANSFVLPQTEIPAGEIWAGVPAKKIDLAEYRSSKEISDAS